VSIFPSGNPNTEPLRDLPPGPHAGVDPDPHARTAPGALDVRARNTLVLGLLSLLFGVLTGIPAIWFGRRALLHLDSADGAPRDRRAAWTGIALGWLSVVTTVIAWIYLHQHDG
jgi:hypothetical protein